MRTFKNFANLLLTLMVLSACEYEPINPANINYNIIDEELTQLVTQISNKEGENPINCLQFNYAFVIYVFDANGEVSAIQSVTSDLDFYNLLESLTPDETISISYPIKGTLETGELIEINTNEELKDAIKGCTLDDQIRKCRGTLQECIWTVSETSDNATNYIGSEFSNRSDGFTRFYHEQVYLGTWASLAIGDSLHVNINLIAEDSIASFWSKDWKVSDFEFESMTLNNNDTFITITKDCEPFCEDNKLMACEDPNTPNTATFNLTTIRRCIGYPINIREPIQFKFYETEEDAIQDTNAIVNTTNYENLENPQEIFIRGYNSVSGDSIYINPTNYILEVIACD